MESRMDQNSVESRSGDAMSIFAQSIDVRRPVRGSRRRATNKILSPEIEQQVKPGSGRRHQRRAVVVRERARAECELSRATTTAKELERQIEQAHTRASSSHGSGLHGTRASGGSGSRRKNGLVDVEAQGGEQTVTQSDAVYAEVMQELERVKSELRKLQREVRSAREAVAQAARDADTSTPERRVTRTGSRPRDSGVEREAGEANEELSKEALQMQHATWTRAKGVVSKDTSRASDTTEEMFATASSSDVEDEESAVTITQHDEHDGACASLQLQAAKAELGSARTELASVKEEAVQFTNAAMDRTREETARRVAEETGRIREQEAKACAQARQLNAELVRARSRLAAAAAEDERAEAALAEVAAAMRRVGEEIKAAGKERVAAEVEAQCVREEVESVGAEVGAAERRVRRAVRELEAARVVEAAAAARLKAAVDAAVMARAADVASQGSGSGDVTIARFEYEYLTGRAEVVRAAAEKKVAAAEAWVEALRAGEKELAMRAEAIEKEIREATAGGGAEDAGCQRADGLELQPRDGGSQQRAPRRRAAATSRRTRTPSASVARKPTPPSFEIERERKAPVQSSCLKVIAGKCGGRG